MKLSIICTERPEEQLKLMVEGLAYDGGWGYGMAVQKDGEKYNLFITGGEPATHIGSLRIVHQDIIASRGAIEQVETLLRGSKRPFEEYEGVNFSIDEALRETTQILSRILEQHKSRNSPDLIYQPQD